MKIQRKILQITAGKGPSECCFVVAKVLKFFIDAIKDKGITYSVLSRVSGTENGTLQSATLLIEGKALDAFLKDWLGTVQWIGQSPYRKYHKRKNWFIGIFEVEKNYFNVLNDVDIQYQAMRSRGAGGQHVNKVSSAVRATHKPTGISVTVMDTRSQHQNKKLARERLVEKIEASRLETLKKEHQEQWNNHINLQRGNPVQVFRGTDFKYKKEDKSYKSKRNQLKNDLRDLL